MNRVKNPCERCTERNPTCHGKCKDYLEFVGYRKWIREKKMNAWCEPKLRSTTGKRTL